MKFLEKYNNSKNIRFKSFEETLKISFNRGFKTIVETGTARGKTKFFFIKKYNWKDGMSTPMFAEYAKFTMGKLHTCDISSKNIENAKKFTSNFSGKFTSKFSSKLTVAIFCPSTDWESQLGISNWKLGILNWESLSFLLTSKKTLILPQNLPQILPQILPQFLP